MYLFGYKAGRSGRNDLYYLQSRYYAPYIKRFLSADDTDYLGISGTVFSYNAFAYCEDDPVNYSDPSGYKKWSIKWISTAINLIVVLIPALVALNKILKTGKGLTDALIQLAKLIKSKGKKIISKIDDWLFYHCATTVGYEITKWIGGTLLSVLSVVCSIGSIIQYLIDCLDGKWDGYLNTSVKLKFRIILKRS